VPVPVLSWLMMASCGPSWTRMVTLINHAIEDMDNIVSDDPIGLDGLLRRY
jgi:hypothetical protein